MDQSDNEGNLTDSRQAVTFISKLSFNEDLVFAIVQLIFCSTSLIGNSCILIFFWNRRSKLNPVEILLLNLGTVDLLLSVASYPMSTISGAYHKWLFGWNGCYFYAFTCYFLALSAMFSIAAIAVLRFLTTCNVASLTPFVTRKTAWVIVTSCYLVAFLWAILPLFQVGEYSFEPFGLSSTLNWLAVSTASQLYLSCVTLICVAIPTLLIIFSYISIILTVRENDALMRTTGIKRNRGEAQLTLATGLISAGFMFAWFPYTVVSLYTTFVSKKILLPMWATPIPMVMAKSSIVYNPLIYLFFPGTYRKEFCKIVNVWWDKSRGRN